VDPANEGLGHRNGSCDSQNSSLSTNTEAVDPKNEAWYPQMRVRTLQMEAQEAGSFPQ